MSGLRTKVSKQVRIVMNAPSPLRGEGDGGVNLNHHPLPNPSPLKGEGLISEIVEMHITIQL